MGFIVSAVSAIALTFIFVSLGINFVADDGVFSALLGEYADRLEAVTQPTVYLHPIDDKCFSCPSTKNFFQYCTVFNDNSSVAVFTPSVPILHVFIADSLLQDKCGFFYHKISVHFNRSTHYHLLFFLSHVLLYVLILIVLHLGFYIFNKCFKRTVTYTHMP
jgi:hypothetical protein